MLSLRTEVWPRPGGWLCIIAVSLSLTACQQKSKNTCRWTESRGLAITGWNGERLSDKELSIIFLKGPSAITRDIAQSLDERKIRASFFVQGASVEAYEAELEELTREGQGHLVGNGGYRFRNLSEAKEPVLELRTTDALISHLVYDNKFLFYAPQKVFNKNLATQLNYNGLGKYVGPIKDDTNPGENFRYDEECWSSGLTPAACALQYQAEIQRLGHGIVAFHDTDSLTLELLDILLPNLVAAGYSFKRLDELTEIAAAFPLRSERDEEAEPTASCQDYE